jgi:hypothetical protein
MKRGVVMVVYGEQAEQSARRACEALESVCPDLPVQIERRRGGWVTDTAESRYAKVTLFKWSPFDHTVYLDADTQVYQPIDAGFQMLADGWDIVIVPSQNQDEHGWLWHCGEVDKAETLKALDYQALQLQAGVFFVAKNTRTETLFEAWRDEYPLYSFQDQGALLRALYQHPVKVWLLGRPWNGGAVIGHHFGAIRRNGNG